MGKKFIIDKLMSGLIGIFSTVIMLFAIMFAMVRENIWPFLVVAALTCPLWHWLLRKYILKDKLLVLWSIRGGAILVGCVLLSLSNRWFPYYKCMDLMIQDRMSTQYENTIKTDTTEFIDVTGIQKELVADYYKIQAVINYQDKKAGEKKSQNMTLYFDRFSGQYFANFDNMRKYREHSWGYEEGIEMCMFEQERVNEITTKLNQALLAGDFEAAQELMSPGLKKTVTKEQWKQWQAVIAAKRDLASMEKSAAEISLDYEMENGKRTGQLLKESWTVKMTGGEFSVEAVLGEDLRFRSIQVTA